MPGTLEKFKRVVEASGCSFEKVEAKQQKRYAGFAKEGNWPAIKSEVEVTGVPPRPSTIDSLYATCIEDASSITPMEGLEVLRKINEFFERKPPKSGALKMLEKLLDSGTSPSDRDSFDYLDIAAGDLGVSVKDLPEPALEKAFDKILEGIKSPGHHEPKSYGKVLKAFVSKFGVINEDKLVTLFENLLEGEREVLWYVETLSEFDLSDAFPRMSGLAFKYGEFGCLENLYRGSKLKVSGPELQRAYKRCICREETGKLEALRTFVKGRPNKQTMVEAFGCLAGDTSLSLAEQIHQVYEGRIQEGDLNFFEVLYRLSEQSLEGFQPPESQFKEWLFPLLRPSYEGTWGREKKDRSRRAERICEIIGMDYEKLQMDYHLKEIMGLPVPAPPYKQRKMDEFFEGGD